MAEASPTGFVNFTSEIIGLNAASPMGECSGELITFREEEPV
jgi:hypothetical protein